VRVNAVAPGFVKTAMNADEWQTDGFPGDSSVMQRTLLPYAAQPEDVASLVGFLAGDGGRFITGQVIPVDGGWSV
jgi:3-oxoacyl-[acyl-carrier protein] reductase